MKKLLRGRLGIAFSVGIVTLAGLTTAGVAVANTASASTAGKPLAHRGSAIYNDVPGLPAALDGTYNWFVDGSAYGQITLTSDGAWTSNEGYDQGSWLVIGSKIVLSDIWSGFPHGGTWAASINAKNDNFGSKANPGIANAPYFNHFSWYARKVKS